MTRDEIVENLVRLNNQKVPTDITLLFEIFKIMADIFKSAHGERSSICGVYPCSECPFNYKASDVESICVCSTLLKYADLSRDINSKTNEKTKVERYKELVSNVVTTFIDLNEITPSLLPASWLDQWKDKMVKKLVKSVPNYVEVEEYIRVSLIVDYNSEFNRKLFSYGE